MFFLLQLYLSQYGYLGISPSKLLNSSSSNLIDGRVLTNAVSEFQSFAGLDVTGKLPSAFCIIIEVSFNLETLINI